MGFFLWGGGVIPYGEEKRHINKTREHQRGVQNVLFPQGGGMSYCKFLRLRDPILKK